MLYGKRLLWSYMTNIELFGQSSKLYMEHKSNTAKASKNTNLILEYGSGHLQALPPRIAIPVTWMFNINSTKKNGVKHSRIMCKAGTISLKKDVRLLLLKRASVL